MLRARYILTCLGYALFNPVSIYKTKFAFQFDTAIIFMLYLAISLLFEKNAAFWLSYPKTVSPVNYLLFHIIQMRIPIYSIERITCNDRIKNDLLEIWALYLNMWIWWVIFIARQKKVPPSCHEQISIARARYSLFANCMHYLFSE